jgi:hypothetical protein
MALRVQNCYLLAGCTVSERLEVLSRLTHKLVEIRFNNNETLWGECIKLVCVGDEWWLYMGYTFARTNNMAAIWW